MELFFMRKFIHRTWANYLRSPAKTNQFGEMVLSSGGWMKWFQFIIFFILATVSMMFFAEIAGEVEFAADGYVYYDEEIEYKIIIFLATGVLAFFMILWWIATMISKYVFNPEEIRMYKFYGKRTIRLADITRIDRSKLFGGAIIIVANNKKSMMIALDNRGISHFVKFLTEQLGPERTENAAALISERRELLGMKES
ncbi:hypothetical protein [Paenibacillus gorillae]|uniref:hypothetical protein n=1 Tax=Paenibacillus gorillae TaxID=1243662 RepID=UPI0005AA1CAA|nr:hypothetical protein [Paenibacillus gorillae]